MSLAASFKRLADVLAAQNCRLVLAESCTAGMIASSLAQFAGISQSLCGSAVVYREETKMRWLGVSGEDIARHTAVSEPIAQQMAEGVLQMTPEADLAASITGHFGPNAPDGFDGLVLISIAWRDGDATSSQVWRHELQATDRVLRQQEAAVLVAEQLLEWLENSCWDEFKF